MTNSVFPKLAGRAVWLVGLVIATLCWTAAGPPASAGWWKPFHDCTSPAYGDGDGTGVAHAALDCKVPLHSGTVVCKSDSTSAYCTSYGNNVSCQGHPTDNFTCSAGAYHYCYQGEGTTTDFRCLLIVLQRAPSSCSSNPPIEQGNPVDITTGTKLERVTDWTSGGNHPLEFSRHYASSFGLLRAPAYSRLGKAWRSNFDARAAYALSPGITIPADAVSGDRLHFVLPDAIEYSFRLSGGVWKPVLPRPHATSPNLVYWDLYRTDIDVSVTVLATSVELRVQDGTRYMFDLDGLLTRIVFPDGYEQGLAYAGGLNTQVTDSFGRRLRFVYDPDLNREGLLSAVLTDDGKRLSFTFQNRAQPPVPQTTIAPDYWALASVIYPDDTPATDTDNPKRSYEYLNDASYPFALTGVFDERGVRYGTWTYDTKGRALSSEHAGGADHYSFQYDDVNNKVTVRVWPVVE